MELSSDTGDSLDPGRSGIGHDAKERPGMGILGPEGACMNRTAAAYKIDQNNTVAEFTKPEIAFDRLFGNRVNQPLPILIVDDEGSKWTLRPDRQFIGTIVLVQIDGVYHRTRRQQKKSEWEDEALNEKGFRVLHIDTELLMTKRYHPYVIDMTEKFLKSNEPSRRLAA